MWWSWPNVISSRASERPWPADGGGNIRLKVTGWTPSFERETFPTVRLWMINSWWDLIISQLYISHICPWQDGVSGGGCGTGGWQGWSWSWRYWSWLATHETQQWPDISHSKIVTWTQQDSQWTTEASLMCEYLQYHLFNISVSACSTPITPFCCLSGSQPSLFPFSSSL